AERATRNQCAVECHQRLDRAVRPAAEARPRTAVPARDIRDADTVGFAELPGDDETRSVHEQGVDANRAGAVLDAGTRALQSRPRDTVPARDVLDQGIAGDEESAADDEIAVVHRERIDAR